MKKELLGVIVKPLFDIPAGVMATAALVTCCRCGAAVRGMGGPMDDVLCLPCARIGLMPDECHSEGKHS